MILNEIRIWKRAQINFSLLHKRKTWKFLFTPVSCSLLPYLKTCLCSCTFSPSGYGPCTPYSGQDPSCLWKMYINYWLFKRKRPSSIENTWWKLPEGHYSFVKAMLVHHVFTHVATMIHARDGWVVPMPHPNVPQCRYQEENLNLGDPFQWCWSWWVKMQKTIDNFPNYWHLHSENSKHQQQFWTV